MRTPFQATSRKATLWDPAPSGLRFRLLHWYFTLSSLSTAISSGVGLPWPDLLKGAVSRQSSSFCLLANYSPSIVMKLKVSKEITCKWQNQRSAINKYVSWALFLKLQPAINLKKADKGTTTVIMNMADKIHEAKVQLDNRKYYLWASQIANGENHTGKG